MSTHARHEREEEEWEGGRAEEAMRKRRRFEEKRQAGLWNRRVEWRRTFSTRVS